jgi:rubrerythrin
LTEFGPPEHALEGFYLTEGKRRGKMTGIEVLKLALTKEESAIKWYQEMLAGHPSLVELLSFLVTEEQKHKKLIEKKIAELSCC